MKIMPNVVVKISCHSRGMLSGIFHVLSRCRDSIKGSALCYNNENAGDPRQKPSGMTAHFITDHGFTLIELLVVVLIIGILAAVALPQYQKAVAKSRFAALKPIAKAVKDAEEIYFDARGTYGALADLDVQTPAGTSLTLGNTDGHDYVRVSSSSGNRYTVYFNYSENFAGNVYCEAEQDNAVANAVCVAEQGQDANVARDSYKWYLLSGSSTGNFPYKLVGEDNLSHPYQAATYYSNGSGTIRISNMGGVHYWVEILDNEGNRVGSEMYKTAETIPSYITGEPFADFCNNYSFVSVCDN